MSRAQDPAVVLATLGPLGEDLELAVREVVANAHEHGVPPVEVRVERVGDELEVVVIDGGGGPRDPGGPSPADADAERGRGRWLAARLALTRERRTPTGFEVRLRARPGQAVDAG